jgi:acetyl esterase/lipase
MDKAKPSYEVKAENGRVLQMVNEDFYHRKFLDVPYADVSPTQKLDIYLPEGEGPFPVIVSIHGGAFAFGDSRGSG